MNEIRWIFTAAAIPSTFTATTIPCAGEFRQCKKKNMNIILDLKKNHFEIKCFIFNLYQIAFNVKKLFTNNVYFFMDEFLFKYATL